MASRTTFPQSPRRGLSILEILVAVGIVLAVAAVAVPWTLGWLGSRELDDAGDRIAMQMLMARAAAREEGRPVEVVASAEGGSRSVEARWVALDGGEDDGGDGDFRGGGGDGDAISRGDLVTRDGFLQSSIDAEWASFALPTGLSIDVGAGGDADDAMPSDGDEPTAGGNASQTLALFLPDGTVLMAPVFMLRTDSGAARAMRVDRATGRARAVEGGETRLGDEMLDDEILDDELVDRPEFDVPADGIRGKNR